MKRVFVHVAHRMTQNVTLPLLGKTQFRLSPIGLLSCQVGIVRGTLQNYETSKHFLPLLLEWPSTLSLIYDFLSCTHSACSVLRSRNAPPPLLPVKSALSMQATALCPGYHRFNTLHHVRAVQSTSLPPTRRAKRVSTSSPHFLVNPVSNFPHLQLKASRQHHIVRLTSLFTLWSFHYQRLCLTLTLPTTFH